MKVILTLEEAKRIARDFLNSTQTAAYIDINEVTIEVPPAPKPPLIHTPFELMQFVREAIYGANEAVKQGQSAKLAAIKAVRAVGPNIGQYFGLADANQFVEALGIK